MTHARPAVFSEQPLIGGPVGPISVGSGLHLPQNPSGSSQKVSVEGGAHIITHSHNATDWLICNCVSARLYSECLCAYVNLYRAFATGFMSVAEQDVSMCCSFQSAGTLKAVIKTSSLGNKRDSLQLSNHRRRRAAALPFRFMSKLGNWCNTLHTEWNINLQACLIWILCSCRCHTPFHFRSHRKYLCAL